MVNLGIQILFVAFLVAAPAAAGEVILRAESDEAYVGVPFLVVIDVVHEQSHTAPRFPELDNVTLTPGEPRSSSQSSVQIINGRRTAWERTTTRYPFRLTPAVAGSIRIPAIEIEVDGETLRTRPATFRVTKSETGDLMYVELTADKAAYYVGEPAQAVLDIWLQPFAQEGNELDANDMWQSLDLRNLEETPFGELLQGRQPQVTVRYETRPNAEGEDKPYYVYRLQTSIWPERSGPLIADALHIVAQYPVRLERTRDIIGMIKLRVAKRKPISAAIDLAQVPQVRSVPTEGRPPYYSGAVGRHAISAEVVPRKARVGDPLTLTLRVSGEGRLDLLQAPALAGVAELAGRFQIADDRLPGHVENGHKNFTVSVRALSAEVAEIPPIPFAWFDPDSETFQTVYSEAIPIEIEAAERMSATQVVESVEGGDRTIDNLTILQTGIEANYTDPRALLAPQGFHLTAQAAAVAAGGPLAYALCALVQLRRRRLQDNVALRRQRGARKQAMTQLSAAESRNDLGLAMGALLGYIADRLNLPPGGMTRQDAVEQLNARQVPREQVERIDQVLQSGEAGQYGGGNIDVKTIGRAARGCIDALERRRL